jgi:HlyD family secretion protein
VTTRRRVALALAAAVLAAAGAAWYAQRARPLVTVVRPERQEVVELVVATGRLRARRESSLGAEVAGVAEEVAVREGEPVAVGQVVVVLRRADVAQALEQAGLAVATARSELARVRAGAPVEEVQRAEAERARAAAARELAAREHVRAQALFAQGLIARAEADRADAAREQAAAAERAAGQALLALRNQPRPEEVRVAEARLRQAEAAQRAAEVELAKRTVRAPFAGVVVQRAVEPGQAVAPGVGLLTVASLAGAELLVETDENNLRRLRPGQRATVIAPAYADRPFAATLRQIGPEVDYARGVVPLRLDPAALPDYARPNMTVDVNVEVARLPDALTVPAGAIVERNGRAAVLVVEGGRVREVPVRVVGRNPDRAAVDGLAADAQVVARPGEVSPGQAVRVRARRAAGSRGRVPGRRPGPPGPA